MKMKLNLSNLLANLLFVLIALLLGAIGLKLNLGITAVNIIFRVGIIFGLAFLLLIIIGEIINLISSLNKKKNPTKIRKKLTDLFNFAESNPDKFIRNLKAKNFLFFSYYFIVCVISCSFYFLIAYCLFVKPNTLVVFPITFIAITPAKRGLEYLLKSGSVEFGKNGINKEEFAQTYNIFYNIVEEVFGKNYDLSLDFGSVQALKATLLGRVVVVNLNSYAFMLFTQEELTALAKREILALKDKNCKKIIRILQSRKFFLSIAPSNKITSVCFSHIIRDTLVDFDFAKNALNRALEKSKDSVIKNSDFAKIYLKAYKKQCVLDRFFSDARSFITLKMCKEDSGLRDFVRSVFNIFLNLVPIYAKEWEKEVENKLKAVVCDRLTYREKIALFGYNVGELEFKDNSTEEQKTIYDKYNVEYHESTKLAYEPKMHAIDNYYREIERYERNSEEYDERLKLIFVAHAYYMTAQLEKAEKIYEGLIEGGDKSTELNFDYGCFLLLAKKDEKGIQYIYQAMENENLVEEGLEVLGRHFIYCGDENTYKEFCEYKAKRLDKIINDVESKMLDKKAKFEKTTLDSFVLSEIIDKLSKDDNIEEIYCADSKTKSGSRIIVFAVSVRNKTQEAMVESYERVFSILDNEYGKYDTFLIYLDAEPDKKLANRIKTDKNHLVFKK